MQDLQRRRAGRSVASRCPSVPRSITPRRFTGGRAFLFVWVLSILVAGCAAPPRAVVVPTAVFGGEDLLIRDVVLIDIVNREVKPGQEILVREGKIAEIRPVSDSVAGVQVIEGKGMLALPGFVNTHTHLWQHVARGFFPSGNLQQWVRIYRYAHYFTRDEIHDAVKAAASQALLSGITTVSDFASSNFSDFSVQATCEGIRDAGVGGTVVWWNPAAFLPADVKQQEIKRLRTACADLELWMGPGPLSFFRLPVVYDGILLARQLGLPLTEHTMENVQEQRDLAASLSGYVTEHGRFLRQQDLQVLKWILGQRTPSAVDLMTELRRRAQRLLATSGGKLTADERRALQGLAAPETISPVPLLEYLDALPGFLSIHSVWSSPADLAIYQRQAVAVSHNPESNQYLSSGIAPVLEMLQGGILVSLGTDGAASNDGIDFFSAMRGLWDVQKLRFLDSSITQRIDAWTVLRVATLDGARALGLEDRTGSLEVGKEADIVLLDPRRLGVSPLVEEGDVDNIAAVIVYSARPRDVDTVLSNGRLLVRGGRLLESDEGALAERLTEISRALVQRQAAGKEWVEVYEVDGRQIGPYLARFRSVRLKDRVSLQVENRGSVPVVVTLMMSGTTFGGTVPVALAPAALQRFPETTPEHFWRKAVPLEPGQALEFAKDPNVAIYRVKTPQGDEQVEGAKSQQLMLLVRPPAVDG